MEIKFRVYLVNMPSEGDGLVLVEGTSRALYIFNIFKGFRREDFNSYKINISMNLKGVSTSLDILSEEEQLKILDFFIPNEDSREK